jgi:hypothetical protein
MKKPPGMLTFQSFNVNSQLSIPERTAQALDWAARTYPRQLVPYNVLLQAVMGFEKMPRLNDQQIEQLRSKMGRVRVILRTKYARGLVSEPGAGVRATVDSADQLKTAVVRSAARHHRSGVALASETSLVNINEVPNTPENAKLVKWYKTDLRTTLAQIGSPQFHKLLEPVPEEK